VECGETIREIGREYKITLEGGERVTGALFYGL